MDVRRESEAAPTKNLTRVERKSEREIVVTRTVNAPARLVFEAWTKAELFRRWWVPKSFGLNLLSCDMDVRVGGQYRLVFRHEESTMAFFGTYLEVTPYSRLVWTNGVTTAPPSPRFPSTSAQARRCWWCTIAIRRRKHWIPARRARCPSRSINSTSFWPAWDPAPGRNDAANPSNASPSNKRFRAAFSSAEDRSPVNGARDGCHDGAGDANQGLRAGQRPPDVLRSPWQG